MTKAAIKKGWTTKMADPVVTMHRVALDKMKKMTSEQIFDVAVRAGIYTRDGKATEPYRSKG